VIDAATLQEGVKGSQTAAVEDAVTPRQKDIVVGNELETLGWPNTNPLAVLSTIKPLLAGLLLPLLLSPTRPLPVPSPVPVPSPSLSPTAPSPQLPTTKPGAPVEEGGLLKELGEVVNGLTSTLSSVLGQAGSTVGTTLQSLQTVLQDLVKGLVQGS
jgi:hypothetical protein